MTEGRMTMGGSTIRIGGNPALRSPFLVGGVSVGLGLLFAAPLSVLFEGLGGWSGVVAFLVVAIVIAAVVLGSVGLAYGVVHWDPSARTARLRGRTVPIDSITEAWRTVSSGGNGAAYVVYRFVSTEGPSVRVLVAGRPMAGLDAAGLKALTGFVAALPLLPPPPSGPGELTDAQRAAAVSITDGGGKSRVSRDTLLAELSAATETEPTAASTGAADTAAVSVAHSASQGSAPHGVISAQEAEALERAWADDDAAAAVLLASSPTRARPLRRVFFWLTFVSFAVGILGIVLGIVMEETDGLVSLDNDDIALVVVGGGVVGVLFYLAWCAVADADVRYRRRLGRAWLSERADDARRRGLPAPLLLAWTEPVRRLLVALAFVGCVAGPLAGFVAAFLFSEPDIPAAVSVAVLVAAVAAVVLGVLAFVKAQRGRRSDAEELIVLGGWRLLPPEVR